MASSNDRNLLIDLQIFRDRILHFVDETYSKAESAAAELLDKQFSLVQFDEINSTLKQCKEKLARVSNSIGPLESLEVAPSAVKVAVQVPSPSTFLACNERLVVPTAKVTLGQSLAVELLLDGPPQSFWLKLKSCSVEKLEKELTSFYSTAPVLTILPKVGSFVVCCHETKFCRGKVVSGFVRHFNVLSV